MMIEDEKIAVIGLTFFTLLSTVALFLYSFYEIKGGLIVLLVLLGLAMFLILIRLWVLAFFEN